MEDVGDTAEVEEDGSDQSQGMLRRAQFKQDVGELLSHFRSCSIERSVLVCVITSVESTNLCRSGTVL
jgi:hypothetical protein